jgi:hypothetical protein
MIREGKGKEGKGKKGRGDGFYVGTAAVHSSPSLRLALLG